MMADVTERFLTRVVEKRKQLGWSQSEFARQLRQAGLPTFHQTTVSRLEVGERPLRLGEAHTISVLLGVPLVEDAAGTGTAPYVVAAARLRELADMFDPKES